jgi:Tfp pilus assembly protein PilF
VYEKLEMWEDVVGCYVVMEKKQRALDIVRARLEAEPSSPLMLCLLGDLTTDTEPYEQAWEASNHTFARAKRSLGHAAFRNHDYPKVVEHYTAAVAINPLNARVWFSLGCAHMRLEQWSPGSEAFVRAVGIDDDNAEAWANLGACRVRNGEKRQALAAFSVAVQHQRGSWKLWQNLLHVAADVGDLPTAITAYVEHIALRDPRQHGIDYQMLQHVAQMTVEARARALEVAEKSSGPAKGTEPSSHAPIIVKRFRELTGKLTVRVATDPKVWGIIADFRSAVDDDSGAFDALVKQCRYAQSSGFESDTKRFESACFAAMRLADAQISAGDVKGFFGVKSTLQSILKRGEANFAAEPFHIALSEKLELVKRAETAAKEAAAKEAGGGATETAEAPRTGAGRFDDRY